MTTRVATPTQVLACVRSAQRKLKDARFLALRALPEWSGPSSLQLDGRQVTVITCPSPLAVRAALVEHAEAPGTVVLLTDRDEHELGLDVLARLAKGTLIDLEPWQIVCELFSVRGVDRRLASARWIAEALLTLAPAEGYEALSTGILDVETAWRHLMLRRFGFTSAAPSLQEVLVWAQEPGRGEALRAEPEEARRALTERLLHAAGLGVRAVLAAVEHGAGERAVALGLCCAVLVHPAREQDGGLREAFVRLERYQGGAAPSLEEARAWAAAAEGWVQARLAVGWEQARPWLAAGEQLLAELKIADRAHLSDLLQAGLDQRLAAWGQELGSALAAKRLTVTAELEDAAVRVGEHALAGEAERQAVSMALRLTRWLAQGSSGDTAAASFEDAVLAYMREGSFVDWARGRVWDQGQASTLRQAYSQLVERVDALRRQEDQRFGGLLAGWVSLPPRAEVPLPIEQVLGRVVAPLAARRPVLLVVLDGMSQPVFRELEEDLYRHKGWVRLYAEDEGQRGPVVAAFPTLTEVSRASLLCGELTTGGQSVESNGFTRHAGLVAVSKGKKPPILFHKAGLEARESGISDLVHAALADPEQLVVGVVVNAVDDHLTKGDQVPVRWTVDQIRPLDALLTAARQAGRVVVLTSDHGHVLDRGTEYRPQADAQERCRPAAGPAPGPDEVRLTGPRVAARFQGAVIAPWSERVRYTPQKHHGYHGGASPAEIVVPLGVFTGSPLELEGWAETPLVQPAWWSREQPQAVTIPPPRAPRAPSATPAPEAGPLFKATAGQPLHWVDQLLASELFLAQHKRAARTAVPVERIREVLHTLEARGGKLTQEALAHQLDLPALRLPGLLAALRRILNVDGYAVLSVEQETVTLNRELLLTQFGLGEGS